MKPSSSYKDTILNAYSFVQQQGGGGSSSSSNSSSSSSGGGSSGSLGQVGASLNEVEEDESPPPAILVYLVDPFSVGQDHPDMHRLVTLGLLRCYEHMLEGLPENMQNNVYLQVCFQNFSDYSPLMDLRDKRT